jgi:hypothetical protein
MTTLIRTAALQEAMPLGPLVLFNLTTVTWDLATADIAVLNGTPVTLVLAQGAGTLIVPVAASFHYKAGSVGFTQNAALSLVYAGDTTALLTGPTIAFSGTTSQLGTFLPATAAQTLTEGENKALVLLASADPTIGTANGSGRITVFYYVMELRS